MQIKGAEPIHPYLFVSRPRIGWSWKYQGLMRSCRRLERVACSFFIPALPYDIKHLPLAILDFDRTPDSRTLERGFLVGDEFKLVGQPAGEAQVADMLQSGHAALALIVPAGFARDLGRGAAPSLQVLLDGTNSNTAAIARGYALNVIDLFDQSRSGTMAAATPSIRPILRVWYNTDPTFTRFNILSMIGSAAFSR